jgi:hypothetical protein
VFSCEQIELGKKRREGKGSFSEALLCAYEAYFIMTTSFSSQNCEMEYFVSILEIKRLRQES